jgi:hypothetical protein
MESFKTTKSILFNFRAKDLLYNIDGFFLALMVDPDEHLAQKTHADELDSDDYQQSAEQEERPAADIFAE